MCKDECIRQGVGEYLMKHMSPPEYIGCFRTTNTKHSRMKVPPLPRFLTESQCAWGSRIPGFGKKLGVIYPSLLGPHS